MKHLPSSEPDPHVVRIGWSINHSSTQLGKWKNITLGCKLDFAARECGGEDDLFFVCLSSVGEEPFSFGYGGTGKKSENCKFADFGERFGENDVIGCYIVSARNVNAVIYCITKE